MYNLKYYGHVIWVGLRLGKDWIRKIGTRVPVSQFSEEVLWNWVLLPDFSFDKYHYNSIIYRNRKTIYVIQILNFKL